MFSRYVAKSGAVIDANIINFSLPKKTAKVEKMLQKKAATKRSPPSKKPIENDGEIEASSSKELKKLGHDLPQNPSLCGVTFPKSSRRETKVPLKYRMDGEFGSAASTSAATTTPAKPKPVQKKPEPKDEVAEREEKEEEKEDNTSPQSKLRTDAEVMVAVKSTVPVVVPSTSVTEQLIETSANAHQALDQSRVIGVGTFSVDVESSKGNDYFRISDTMKTDESHYTQCKHVIGDNQLTVCFLEK